MTASLQKNKRAIPNNKADISQALKNQNNGVVANNYQS
jgi:hypothetical protein